MARHSFIQMSKLPNVKGRISYITSHARQENLYATYRTADNEFWSNLARESQQEFKRSGTEGKCIEARELIIALPEIYTRYEPQKVLEDFTEEFHRRYGVECVSALHHNKRKTNYHIHLIFSERKRLPESDIKIATRSVFYDETGKRVRTKKIGKNNPKAAEIEADNTARQEWNRTADMALLSGISEAKILGVKQTEIHEKASQSIMSKGWLPNLFRGIVAKAKDFLQSLIREKDMLPDILKEDGYPDVQAFMRTFREMESVVEQYNRDLAEWERQVSRKPTATAKAQYRPPEKQSVLKHLREIQERNKQKPPQRQRKKSFDRDSR